MSIPAADGLHEGTCARCRGREQQRLGVHLAVEFGVQAADRFDLRG